MIRHVVLFRWTAEATAEQKQQVQTELRALPPLMTGLRSYRAVIAECIAPIRQDRASVQYET